MWPFNKKEYDWTGWSDFHAIDGGYKAIRKWERIRYCKTTGKVERQRIKTNIACLLDIKEKKSK